MKSKKLRKLVAGIAMLAVSVTVGTSFTAQAVDIPQFENGWAINNKAGVNVVVGQGIKLTNNPTKTTNNLVTIESAETEVLTNDVVVNGKTYVANSNEGGIVRLGLRFNGALESFLRSYITDAVNEHKANVNTVNSNRHNTGTTIKSDKQFELGKKLHDVLFVKNSAGHELNRDTRFIVTYEINGSTRTTSIGLSDLTIDMPITDPALINSADSLRSLVSENGLVYVTLRGLPSNITITDVELDSRRELSLATSANGTTYNVQTKIDYNAGKATVPASTWALTGSLYPQVTVNGTKVNQFVDAGNKGVIEANEHAFVEVQGGVVTLVDILRDRDNVIKSVKIFDRNGNAYDTEVGQFVSGKYRYTEKVNGQEEKKVASIDYGSRYKDVKIKGLSSRTTYDFDRMEITYKYGDVEKVQKVQFNNAAATGGVTGNKYLTVATADFRASQINAYNTLGNNLYQVYAGKNKLEYLIKVSEASNLDRIEVRGLRNGETYKVSKVKTADGKKDSSDWYVISLEGLEQNRDYSFLTLETVYNENGRERYGAVISLGGRNNDLSTVLFPGNDIPNNGYNWFTTTNNNNVSEAWIDSTLKTEEVPGGVKFYGRVKDADDILEKVNVYVNNGSRFVKLDDSQVKLEKSYRVIKGLDVNSDGSISGTQIIDYPFIINGNFRNISVTEKDVESASEIVEVTVTGIEPGSNKDYKLEFVTKQNGNTVSAIRTGNIGAFGSMPSGSTKTQQIISRFVTGKAGASKVQINASNAKVTNVTFSTAVVDAGINNPNKESIMVEASMPGVVAKYDPNTNLIDLTGLQMGTEYKDLKLTIKYANTSTVVTLPTFSTSKPSTGEQVDGGVSGYVRRVYSTFFNRVPDKQGLEYWTSRLKSGQETLSGFLRQLAFTPELLQRNLSDEQFVKGMYVMVNRPGETDGVNFWVGEIKKYMAAGKTQSEARANVVERMLDTPEVRGMADRLGVKFQ